MCGGTRHCEEVHARRLGLSPRVRGNRTLPTCRKIRTRSIPACAGEPGCICERPGTLGKKVYPRVCGGTGGRWEKGLSPRVRGKKMRRNRVYPRVCGGTTIRAANGCYRYGLSPRVRGNQAPDRRSQRRRRSIPACAGEPCEVLPRCGAPGVYPRVCGGTQ